MTRYIIYSLLFFGSLSFSGCKKKHHRMNAPASDNAETLKLTDKQMKFIKIDSVHWMPSAEQFVAIGEVSFAEDNVVRVYPIVSGKVESVSVSLGDYVQKGQLLATLLSGDVSVYQRNYNVAEANLEVAQKNLARADELFKSGMMSEKELAEAKKDYVNSKSEFDESKQVLNLYGGSSQQDAIFKVVAPRSGYIVERNINTGTPIRTDNSASIFTISDLKTVWIWANVHEGDISKIKEGDALVVKTIAYPDEIFEGHIDKINAMLDPASRVVRVRTELVNSKGLLKPEMFATIQITPRSAEKVLVVNNNAVLLENNQYYVMLQKSPGEFAKIQVQIGRVFHRHTEVKEGLQSGNQVVTDGSLFVMTAFNQL